MVCKLNCPSARRFPLSANVADCCLLVNDVINLSAKV